MNGVGALELAVMQRWTLSGPLEYNDPLAGTGARRDPSDHQRDSSPTSSDNEPPQPDRKTIIALPRHAGRCWPLRGRRHVARNGDKAGQ